MDATLKEIYSLVLTQWPLVAGAYALLWAGLIAYVGFALKRVRALERQVEVLEAALARRAGASGGAAAGTSGGAPTAASAATASGTSAE